MIVCTAVGSGRLAFCILPVGGGDGVGVFGLLLFATVRSKHSQQQDQTSRDGRSELVLLCFVFVSFGSGCDVVNSMHYYRTTTSRLARG